MKWKLKVAFTQTLLSERILCAVLSLWSFGGDLNRCISYHSSSEIRFFDLWKKCIVKHFRFWINCSKDEANISRLCVTEFRFLWFLFFVTFLTWKGFITWWNTRTENDPLSIWNSVSLRNRVSSICFILHDVTSVKLRYRWLCYKVKFVIAILHC